MIPWQAFIDDVLFSFRKHKAMAEKAFAQLENDAEFFHKPGELSNSIALIVKHVAGNLASRWTDFLTSDGEKPWRDRDAEFVITALDTRTKLLADWEHGWQVLLQTLASLDEGAALRQVAIRGEAHTVLQALQRSLTHTSYHVGQITYLARLLKQGGAAWITIAPGQSQQFGKPYLR